MKRLVLIDGNAILHRAYHALPPLTAPDGALVNAVYGFTSMLLKLTHDLKPTHLAVAFDRPAPTFRKKLFAQYQATRPKMDEELSGQIELVHKVLGSFGIPIYEVDGYEADDIIGTVCQNILHPTSKTSNPKKPTIDQVIIVTGDRDLLQLVEEGKVFVWMPTRGLSEAQLFGDAETKEKMGVEPEKIPDLKALCGDPSDNYPGVSGIGPKTAIELVATFGSVEELFAAIRKKDPRIIAVPQGTLTKLLEGKESAELSKKLATIRTDVPIQPKLEQMKIEALDQPLARQALAELNFQSLLKRLAAPQVNGNKKRAAVKPGQVEKEKPKAEQQPLF